MKFYFPEVEVMCQVLKDFGIKKKKRCLCCSVLCVISTLLHDQNNVSVLMQRFETWE